MIANYYMEFFPRLERRWSSVRTWFWVTTWNFFLDWRAAGAQFVHDSELFHGIFLDWRAAGAQLVHVPRYYMEFS
jgi:hypothetical protein